MRQGILVGILVLTTTGLQGIKDLMIAYAYGTTPAADAFQFAYNFLFNIQSVFSSAMTTALIPVYVSARQHSGRESAWAMTLLVARRSTAALALIAAVAWLIFQGVISTVAGFSADTRAQSLASFNFMLFGLVLSGVAAVFVSAANADGRNAFASLFPSFGAIPVLLTAAMVFRGGADPRAIYLALATLGAALLQFLVLLGFLRASGYSASLDASLIDPASVKRVGKLFVVIVSGSLLLSTTVQVNQYVAANIGPGALATLVNGQKLVALVAAVASNFILVMLLPRFSHLVASGQKSTVLRELLRIVGWSAAAGIVFIVLVSLAPKAIVQLVFQRGQFDANDSVNVAAVLQLAIFQLPFFLVGQVINQYLLAHHQHKLLAFSTLVMAVVCVPMAFVLASSWGLAGVVINGVLVYVITSACLVFFVSRQLRA